MTTYTSGAAFVKAQKELLADLQQVRLPFERAVRSALVAQQRRIFEEGKASDGGRIGSYDTTRELYVNPKQSPRASAFVGKGIRLEGLKPPRGKPSPLWQTPSDRYPQGEEIFAPDTAWRGGKGTKAGDPHQTTWVKNYKDFRNRIGRRVDTVDLILTGDLRSDFSTAALRGKAQTTSRGLELVVTLKRAKNAEKRAGLEDKYGPIFTTTPGERAAYFDLLRGELRRARERRR